MLAAFSRAPDVAAQQRIAAELHEVVYELTPSILWGQFTRPAGYRSTLGNLIKSAYPMFWEVEKA
jgi:peptide/nickel transport system substrate-binding protein